jgi:hypothetical protein
VSRLQDILENSGVFLGDRGKSQNQEAMSPVAGGS